MTVDKEKLFKTYSAFMSENNVTVKYDHQSTASYNYSQNCITMPYYENIPSVAEFSLVVHETAHVMYSRDLFAGDSEKFVNLLEKYEQIDINLVEDIFIEKKIKAEYPGVRKILAEGYREFHEIDFFNVRERNVPLSDYGFKDRLNLHFKIGHVLPVPFSPEEMRIVDDAKAMETREDFFDILDRISDFKDNPKTPEEDGQGTSGEDSGEDSEDENKKPLPFVFEGDSEADSSPGEEKKEPFKSPENLPVPENEIPDKEKEEEKTESVQESVQECFEKNLSSSAQEMIPALNNKLVYNDVSFDTAEFYSSVDESNDTWTSWKKCLEHGHRYSMGTMSPDNTQKRNKLARFNNFVRENASIISSVFNNRKNMFNMSNASNLQTGQLDMKRLHAYKTSDNIFKRKINSPKQQNHAAVFMLDFSGSMQNYTASIMTQSLVAMEFCNMNGIPFTAYAFSSLVDNYSGSVNCSLRMPVKKICDESTYVKNDIKKIFGILLYEINKKDGIRSSCMLELFGAGGRTPSDFAMCAVIEKAKEYRKKGYEKIVNFFFTDGYATSKKEDHMHFNTVGLKTDAPRHRSKYAPLEIDTIEIYKHVFINGIKYNLDDFTPKEAFREEFDLPTTPGDRFSFRTGLAVGKSHIFSTRVHLPMFKYLKECLGVDTILMLYDSTPDLALCEFYAKVIGNMENLKKNINDKVICGRMTLNGVVVNPPDKLFTGGSIFVNSYQNEIVTPVVFGDMQKYFIKLGRKTEADYEKDVVDFRKFSRVIGTAIAEFIS
jgi:hypothetical protein